MLNQIRGYFVEDPAKAATDSINGALLDCDIIIALAHMNHSEIESFAQKVPKIFDHHWWTQPELYGCQNGQTAPSGSDGCLSAFKSQTGRKNG